MCSCQCDSLIFGFRLRPSFVRITIVAFVSMCMVAAPYALANDFQVGPKHAELNGIFDRIQLTATDSSDKDRPADVTRKVRFENRTPEVLSISETGTVTPIADGNGFVRVHLGSKSTEIKLTVSGTTTKANVSFRNQVMPVPFESRL